MRTFSLFTSTMVLLSASLTMAGPESYTPPPTKYEECNDWIGYTFPKDKMFSITDDGKIIRGKNAGLASRFEQDDKKGKTIISYEPKNSSESLYINITKEDQGFSISRQYTNRSKFALSEERNIYSLSLGKNGKCYVDTAMTRHPAVTHRGETKICHDILKFKRGFPDLRTCGNKRLYERLAKILYGEKALESTSGLDDFSNAKGGLSKEFIKGLDIGNKLIMSAERRLDECDKVNLTGFARDSKLFDEPRNKTRGAAGAVVPNN